MCTAHTDPYLDLDHKYHHTIFSRDPGENPAFWDFSIGEQQQDTEQIPLVLEKVPSEGS